MPSGNVFQSNIEFGEMDVRHANGTYRIGTTACHQYNHYISNKPTYHNWHMSLSRELPLLPALPVRFHVLVQQTASCKGTDPCVEVDWIAQNMFGPCLEVPEHLA